MEYSCFEFLVGCEGQSFIVELDKMTKCKVLWHDEKVTEVISSAEHTTNLR